MQVCLRGPTPPPSRINLLRLSNMDRPVSRASMFLPTTTKASPCFGMMTQTGQFTAERPTLEVIGLISQCSFSPPLWRLDSRPDTLPKQVPLCMTRPSLAGNSS